jgi:predicted DNA-binding helix-hairpin-helix protein
VKAVDRLLQARRVRRIRAADLQRLHVPSAKVLPFVVTTDHTPRGPLPAPVARSPEPIQGALF